MSTNISEVRQFKRGLDQARETVGAIVTTDSKVYYDSFNQNRETMNSDWQNNSVRADRIASTNNRETIILTSKVAQLELSMRFNQNRETMSSNRQNNSARAVRTVSTNN